MFKIQKLDLLIGFYIAALCVSELMGAKTFHLLTLGPLRFNASIAIVLVVFLFTVNDIIVEVYGKERAQSIARTGLLMIAFLFFFSLFAIWVPPSSRFAPFEGAYDEVFARSARISAASLIAFSFSLFLDIQVFARLRQKLGKKELWLRNNASNFLSQLVDTVVFMTVAFYAFDTSFSENAAFLFSLILPYWLLKCSISVLETPFVYLGVKWLKGDPTPAPVSAPSKKPTAKKKK